ncbi:hypothetical protein TNIN_318061 [Trichonephila inaurata madagascariensis]|uniref:Uncharacterized protein n=1 Tax=Trichonephila inaurata madagascariensis TaxID=2747483 RepID=A0A8X7CSH0_9ARAC|nr:hypothetical protein TNIN_318061 [Trichonephila inaurata madagascariensis]
MEDSKQLENAARIFATKLVHCVMRKDIPTWIPEPAVEDDDIFPDFMQTEIESICEEESIAFLCEFRQSFFESEKTNETFNKFCSRMSSIIQHQEVQFETFLNYAARLAKTSTYIYEDVVEAPNIAIGHITNVIVTRYPYLVKKIQMGSVTKS